VFGSFLWFVFRGWTTKGYYYHINSHNSDDSSVSVNCTLGIEKAGADIG